MSALTVPEPLPNDPEDLSTALETAAIFSAQGDAREAVRWVRRAAELAGDAGDDLRALALARAVADLGASVSPSKPAPAPEPAAAAPAAPAAAPAAQAETPPLPPPPPLPDRSVAAALESGDRVTSPGIAPPSTSPAVPAVEAAQEAPAATSRPHSVPPPTASEDAGWNESDSEPETPRPTNGAAENHAAAEPAAEPEPAAPAVAEPQAAAAPVAPAPVPVAIPLHQAARVRVEATTETGVFRVTLLPAGESAGAEADEGLLVLLDPSARLDA